MNKYKLTSVDHELVFKILKIDILSKGISVNSPTAIIVGGQPGAGKTNLISSTRQYFNNNYIIINGDDYRQYHPYFYEIAYNNDKKIAEFIDPSVRDWTRRLFNLSMENSYNTILEITLRQHEPILTTINNLYKNNFNICLRILAVRLLPPTARASEWPLETQPGGRTGRCLCLSPPCLGRPLPPAMPCIFPPSAYNTGVP
jgi:hypothetical protein